MEFREIGRLKVSVVGLGCNNFGRRCDQEQTAQVVGSALEAGINFFDTADVYGGGLSEEFLGKALGSRRDEVVIATKFGFQMGDDAANQGGSPGWVTKAVEASLKRLGRDRIYLYQMHTPDEKVPIEETLRALSKLIEEGKVREIGSSNFSGEQIDDSVRVSGESNLAQFVSAQNHYSLLHRDPEDDVIEACSRNSLAQIPYFPLANGLLTGKYQKDAPAPRETRLGSAPAERASRWLNEHNFDVVEKLDLFVKQAGKTLLELAISWLTMNPTVASVIAGATKPDQVAQNAQSANWKMSPQELAKVDAIAQRLDK